MFVFPSAPFADFCCNLPHENRITKMNRLFSFVFGMIGAKLVTTSSIAFFWLPSLCLGQTYNGFTYSVNGTAITITGYNGLGGAVTIPSTIPGVVGTVTSIGEDAFYRSTNLTSLTIGTSVTSIGNSAFNGCSSLTNV